MPWGSSYKAKPNAPAGTRSGGYGSAFHGGTQIRAGRGGPVSKAHPNGGGGGNVLTRFGSDLVNVAENAPGGVAKIGEAAYQQVVHGEGSPLHKKGDAKTPLTDLAVQSAKQVKTDLQHPLRHPGYTALDVLPIFNAAGKVAEAGSLAKAGAPARTVLQAATRGVKPGVRELDVNGLKVRGHYSGAAGSRVVQKAVDSGLQKAAERPGRIGVQAENALHRRAAKWETRNQRVADAVARAPGTTVQALGKGLKPEELRALRLAAEEAPVERRLAAQTLRQAGATSAKETARHQERIDLTRKAQQFLSADKQGKPILTSPKLRKVYDAMKTASTDRETMLKDLNLMDQESLQAAKTKTARVASGAQFDKVAKAVVGAEDITASPQAIHIGNPVERTKISGNPKVSSTGTFGHTRKPSSLRVATGGSVEHALERNDVTNIVAERHSEAVRLAKIDRVRMKFAQAGEAAPRRKDDVFVWTDKLTKNERIPKEVRQYLDNPEGLAKLPPDEQLGVTEKLKQAVFHEEDWRDPEKVAEFQKLAKQGKGTFVPRRLLGQFAKRDYSLGHIPGVNFVDAVNNAQKAGLVYLKVNYPVVQGVSNVAMNLIHQGFAYPRNLTAAIRLEKKVGPEFAAITDDIMGEGAVRQVGFQGQGAISHASQKLAQVMSTKVDTPARRAAFYHEAMKAGFKTREQYQALLTDPQYAGDLAEVAQRAKEAIVDYEDLSPFERSVVKRLVFVYPWQKGATKYAGHFLRDHPVQAAALGQAGVIGKNTADEQLGPVPTYLNGIFKVGGGVVNPAGVNFFQTPAQIGQAVGGLVTGNPAEASSGLGFLSPAPGVLAGLLSGQDDIGRPLKGNALAKARDLTVAQTPLAALARAAAGKYSVVRDIAGSHASSKTFPHKNDAFWRFLAGGLYPRGYDQSSLNQNAARQKVGR